MNVVQHSITHPIRTVGDFLPKDLKKQEFPLPLYQNARFASRMNLITRLKHTKGLMALNFSHQTHPEQSLDLQNAPGGTSRH